MRTLIHNNLAAARDALRKYPEELVDAIAEAVEELKKRATRRPEA